MNNSMNVLELNW